jgi:hypothetical protein
MPRSEGMEKKSLTPSSSSKEASVESTRQEELIWIDND